MDREETTNLGVHSSNADESSFSGPTLDQSSEDTSSKIANLEARIAEFEKQNEEDHAKFDKLVQHKDRTIEVLAAEKELWLRKYKTLLNVQQASLDNQTNHNQEGDTTNENSSSVQEKVNSEATPSVSAIPFAAREIPSSNNGKMEKVVVTTPVVLADSSGDAALTITDPFALPPIVIKKRKKCNIL